MKRWQAANSRLELPISQSSAGISNGRSEQFKLWRTATSWSASNFRPRRNFIELPGNKMKKKAIESGNWVAGARDWLTGRRIASSVNCQRPSSVDSIWLLGQWRRPEQKNGPIFVQQSNFLPLKLKQKSQESKLRLKKRPKLSIDSWLSLEARQLPYSSFRLKATNASGREVVHSKIECT